MHFIRHCRRQPERDPGPAARGEGGLASRVRCADWLVRPRQGKNPDVPVVVLAVGAQRFGVLSVLASQGGWRRVGLASLRRS